MMNKKRLPKIGDICYITFKVSETETTEELGYLDISQVEDEVENGFVDEDGNCFEYFFHIPAIDKHFEINQLVSWRDINGWISVEDRLPDMHPHDYYGELSNDILLYGIDDSGSNPHIFIGFMIEGNIFYSNEYGMCGHGNVTHWQPHPPLPKDNL